MKGIVKQYRFICSSGEKYGHNFGNCKYCDNYSLTVTADTEEEAIEKFKKCGGRIKENGEIVMPETFCSLAGE